MIRPCPNVSDCPDDVFGNLSVEEPDFIDYLSIQFASFPPPLINPTGQIWSATECGATFISHTSQEDADMQAAAAAILCAFHTENPGVTPIFNTPSGSQCCVKCPDGTEFCFTAPPIFGALNLAQANQIAHQIACTIAKAHLICLSNLTSPICISQPFNQTVTATGALGICTWTIEDGSLPDGLLMRGVAAHIATTLDNHLPITGTPTTLGDFFFTLRCTAENGFFMQKQYEIVVQSCAYDTELLIGGVLGFASSLPKATLSPHDNAGGTLVAFGYGGPSSSGQLVWPNGQLVTVSTDQIANTLNVPGGRTRFTFYGWGYIGPGPSFSVIYFNPADPGRTWTAAPAYVGSNPIASFTFGPSVFSSATLFELKAQWATRYANFSANTGPPGTLQLIETAQDVWRSGSIAAFANDGSQTAVVPGGWTRLINGFESFWDASMGSDILGTYTHIDNAGNPIADGHIITVSAGGFLT